MIIIGCDFHPSLQQIAWVDTETGEIVEQKLMHASGEAERFYCGLQGQVRVGIESTGNCHWFVDMLLGMGHEVWMGDAAKIRAQQIRKQKTDRRDAAHILDLLLKNDFPRIWIPSKQERDHRQLLLHRHKLVTLRVRVKNELQHLALNQGLQKGRSLWSLAGQKQLLELPLAPWAGIRRQDLLELLKKLDQQILVLDHAVKKAAEENEKACLLMTQPGVGPITSLAFVLTIGDAARFLRMLLVEAAQSVIRHDPKFLKEYQHRCHYKPKAVAKVAAARKLAVRLFWMLRTNKPYPEVVRIESSSQDALAG